MSISIPGEDVLKWRDCSSPAAWNMTLITEPQTGTVSPRVSPPIRLSLQGTNTCLQSLPKEDTFNYVQQQVVLVPCAQNTPEQEFQIVTTAVAATSPLCNVELIFNGSYVATDPDTELSKLKVSFVEEDTPEKPCHKFSVRHGKVVTAPSAPFFLPGEQITVLCDEGFGAGHFNQYYILTCSAEMKPRPCTKLEQKGLQQTSNKDIRERFCKVFILSTIVSSVLAVCMLILYSQAKCWKVREIGVPHRQGSVMTVVQNVVEMHTVDTMVTMPRTAPVEQ